MNDLDVYVPVLRWKQAEVRALANLGADVCEGLIPLFEFTPPCYYNKDWKKTKSRNALIAKHAVKLRKIWSNRPFMVDMQHVPPELALENQDHVLSRFAIEAEQNGLRMTPVIGLGRGVEYEEATKMAAGYGTGGIALRVTTTETKQSSFDKELDALLALLGVEPAEVDLLVEYGYLENASQKPNLPAILAALPNLSQWKTLTVIGGAFPMNMQNVPLGMNNRLQRLDWELWKDCVNVTQSQCRKPRYGDFTTQHPIFKEAGKWIPSANIRYALESEWLVLRGESLKSKTAAGYQQYVALANQLCKKPEFMGAPYSEGDQYTLTTSQTPAHPGTPGTWLYAGINHHLTLTVRQIRALRDFGGAS